MSISAAFILPHPPLIVPEVGKGQEEKVQKTIDGYHCVARQIGEIKPDTVIVISPHSTMYADYIHVSPKKGAAGSFKRFGAPVSVRAKYDTQLVEEISRICVASDFPAGTLGEKDSALDHGTLVPLYFVNQYHADYSLVRCSVSGLSRQEHYRFGMILRQAVDALGRNAVVIASGDLSHRLSNDGPYGFAPEGPVLDGQLVDIMKSANFGDFFELDSDLCERGAECGLASFVTMAGALDRTAVEPRFLSYEGTFGVGYAVCAYTPLGEDSKRNFLEQYDEKCRGRMQSLRNGEDDFVRLARETLENYVKNGKLPEALNDMPYELANAKAGVFVSIKKEGKLRGCIGTTEPTKPSIALEIMHNAISAGTQDSRFSPVKEAELPGLVYSVDVLTPARRVIDKSMLDAKRYGVIVTKGRRRGLLLPDLEGVDTVEQQISIACQKAGIDYDGDYELDYFEVIRHK